MSGFEIGQAVKRELGRAPTSPRYRKAVDLLREVADQLELAMPEVDFVAAPYYPTDIGQQWRGVARMPHTGHEQVVFRACVALDGKPLRFDFHGEDLVECSGLGSAKDALTRFFTLPTTLDMLRDLRDMATVY